MAIERVFVKGAPKPLGAYSHAVVVDGRYILTAGLSGRDPRTNKVPGVVVNEKGERVSYDIRLEARACFQNLLDIVVAAGGSVESIVEVEVFLTDMKDFGAYNEVFSEFFSEYPPARTTVGVSSLPGPLAIEIKAVALRGEPIP